MHRPLILRAATNEAGSSASKPRIPLDEKTTASISAARLAQLKETLMHTGIKFLKSHPAELKELVDGGKDSSRMLLELMGSQDEGGHLHIPCAAVAVAIDIVKTGDKESVRVLLDGFQKAKEIGVGLGNIIDVLQKVEGRENRLNVLTHVRWMLDEGLKLRGKHGQDKPRSREEGEIVAANHQESAEISAKAHGTMMAKLAISTMMQIGGEPDAKRVCELLDNDSKEIRNCAAACLKEYSMREDVPPEARMRLAVLLLYALCGGRKTDYYAERINALAEGNFKDCIPKILEKHGSRFSTETMGANVFHGLLNRFFGNIHEVDGILLNLLDTAEPKTLEHILNTLKNKLPALVDGGYFSPEQLQGKICKPLKDRYWQKGMPFELRKKISDIMAVLPEAVSIGWRTRVYNTKGTPEDMELLNYVSGVFERAGSKRQVHKPYTIVIVSADTAFLDFAANFAAHTLSVNNLTEQIQLVSVDSGIEAANVMLRERENVLMLIATQNILLPDGPPSPLSWEYLANFLADNKLSIPMVLAQGTQDAALPGRIERLKQAGVKLKVEDKSKMLQNDNILYHKMNQALVFVRAKEDSDARISLDVKDYLMHPYVHQMVEKEFGAPLNPTPDEPYGENVLVVPRNYGANIESVDITPDGQTRRRISVYKPAATGAMIEHPGIKERTIRHLGAFDLGRPNVLNGRHSLRVNYDLGGRTKTGKWGRSEVVSLGGIIHVIQKDKPEGYWHFVDNRSKHAILLLVEDKV